MRISRGVIEQLVANDIDTLFGIPGKQTLPLNEAIGNRDDIRFVVARHETAVSHEAWGYAETSGELAATVVIPGPGDMHAMNGLKNALNDCTPLVHIAVETSPKIRGGDGIHETPPDTYDNVVKENVLVENPESTLVVLQRAIDIAQTPPKGPVRVGIPKNFLPQDVPLGQPGTYTQEAQTDVSEEAVCDAVDVLAGATEPFILAGGGVRAAEASVELLSVADQLGAPIVTTYKGKGVVSDYNDQVAGTLSGSASPELLAGLAEADVLLAVGTDFDAVSMRSWTLEMPDDIVHVTLSPDDLGTGYDPTVGVVGDARQTLHALSERLEEVPVGPGQGVERAREIRAATEARIEPLQQDGPPLSSVHALGVIRDVLPRETIISADAGGFRVWALNVFEAAGPQRYVNPGSWATMSTGLPAGIGAQLSNPDEDVVVLTGDGGLMMCLHELHTAVAESLPVTVVVFNNSDYAIISEAAARNFELPDQTYGWDDVPLDFATVAEGMGMQTMYAETADEIRDGLDTALAADEPTLVEIPTDPTEPQAREWMTE